MGMDKMDLSKIQLWPIEKLTPYENNPRQNDSAVTAVAESIKEFGFKQPIVVDKDGVVIAGHTRLKAAKQLELKTIPVLLADDLTPDQVKAYRLADNKTGELAFWDMEKLMAPARKTWSHNRRLDSLKKERRRGMFVFNQSAA